jgi:hypothetical protein
MLRQGAIPEPPEAQLLIDYEGRTAAPGSFRTRPVSLLHVAEAIRLWSEGETAARIARRLDYHEATLSDWVAAARRVEQRSGFRLADLHRRRSYEGKKISSVGRKFSTFVCGKEETGWTRNWVRLWQQRYRAHLKAPYFADADELIAWIDGLMRLGVAPADIRLVRPSNLADDAFVSLRGSLLERRIQLENPTILRRPVNERSGSASRRAALGVFVQGAIGRSSLQSEIAWLVFCAAVLFETA